MNELPLSPAGRKYGALKSRRNATDLGKPRFFGLPATLPPSYSLEQWAPAVKDQGDEGSCTGHGWTSNAEFLSMKFNRSSGPLSPAFVYYMERAQEGTLGDGDCGAQVVTGANVMDLKGAPSLAQESYVPGDISTAPTPSQVEAALLNRTGAYHRLATIMDVKECIVSGYAIVIGFSVYDSFEQDGMAKSGLMPMPDTSKESLLGGHCVFGGLAYDDTKQCPGAKPGAVKMQNSWGTAWGITGRFWMPYDFLQNPDLVSDIFIQHLGKAW